GWRDTNHFLDLPSQKMMTRRSLIALPIAANCTGADERRCSVIGDLEIRPFSSAVFPGSRNLRVLLPQRYRTSPTQHYPVLYLNDGQNLFDTCTSIFGNNEWRVDEIVSRLSEEGTITPLIVVGVDNGGRQLRAKEYLPWGDETLHPPVSDPQGALYPKFLLD